MKLSKLGICLLSGACLVGFVARAKSDKESVSKEFVFHDGEVSNGENRQIKIESFAKIRHPDDDVLDDFEAEGRVQTFQGPDGKNWKITKGHADEPGGPAHFYIRSADGKLGALIGVRSSRSRVIGMNSSNYDATDNRRTAVERVSMLFEYSVSQGCFGGYGSVDLSFPTKESVNVKAAGDIESGICQH